MVLWVVTRPFIRDDLSLPFSISGQLPPLSLLSNFVSSSVENSFFFLRDIWYCICVIVFFLTLLFFLACFMPNFPNCYSNDLSVFKGQPWHGFFFMYFFLIFLLSLHEIEIVFWFSMKNLYLSRALSHRAPFFTYIDFPLPLASWI